MIALPRSVPFREPLPQRVPVRVALGPTCTVVDELWMPFAPARHPDTAAIGAASRAWLRGLGLLDDRNAAVFARARFEELAGRVYYDLGASTVRLAADFIAALFVLDDWLDATGAPATRDAALAAAALAALRTAARTGVAPPADAPLAPVAAALADLTARLRAAGGRLDRYLAELDVYLDGVIAETGHRTRGYASLADYAEARVAFSAVYACVELGLAAHGRALAPALRPLARAANLSVSWVNDLYSWPKERALGERSNLIPVLLPGCDDREPDAFHAACRACDDVVADVVGFAPRARAIDPVGAALCAAWIRGNYDWHAAATDRYVDRLSVAPRDGGA